MGCSSSTPSHGNPYSNNALNTELNNVARNTDNCDKARELVARGADLSSTNGPEWRHTPLHQAAYHGRYEMALTLVQLGARLDLPSNPCGRGELKRDTTCVMYAMSPERCGYIRNS
jgi:ankyrin repeat protein